MKKNGRRPRTPALPTIAEGWNLDPGAVLDFETVAEAMRKSTATLAVAIMDNSIPFGIGQAEAMGAIATGSLGYAVDAYLRFFAAMGLPLDEIRGKLNEAVDDIWKQSAEAHVRHLAEKVGGQA